MPDRLYRERPWPQANKGLIHEELDPVLGWVPVTEAESPGYVASIVVYGSPATMGSKRIGRSRAGVPIVLDANDAGLRSWQQQVTLEMRRVRPVVPWDCAVSVSIVVYVDRPRSHFGTGRNAGKLKDNAPYCPASGRDLDKVARALLDCGKNAGWYTDDQRVSDLVVIRRYAREGACVTVRCEEAGR